MGSAQSRGAAYTREFTVVQITAQLYGIVKTVSFISFHIVLHDDDTDIII